MNPPKTEGGQNPYVFRYISLRWSESERLEVAGDGKYRMPDGIIVKMAGKIEGSTCVPGW